jgi:hypothetical protein
MSNLFFYRLPTNEVAPVTPAERTALVWPRDA